MGGELVGVVGATTPSLATISSPGEGIGIAPADDEDFAALAAEIQTSVDALTAIGINKIVLLSHFQQIGIEQEVAALLDDVDIVIAGGSNTILANEDDPLRAGDESDGAYPLAVDSDGETVYVVNTDGNYRYVGRLVVDFDDVDIVLVEQPHNLEQCAGAILQRDPQPCESPLTREIAQQHVCKQAGVDIAAA